MTCQYCRVIGCVGSQARKERHMHEDDHKQEQEADDEREGRALARSLPAKPAHQASLQGEGSWANLLNWLEVSPDALVLVDAAGRIARVNSQTEALFGYTRSELEGEALDALLPERFRAAHGRGTGVVWATQRWHRVSGGHQPEPSAVRRRAACAGRHS